MSIHSTYPASFSASGLIAGEPSGVLTIPAEADVVVILTVKESNPQNTTAITCSLLDGEGNSAVGNVRGAATYAGTDQLETTFIEFTAAQLGNLNNLTPTIDFSDPVAVSSRHWCAFFLNVGEYLDNVWFIYNDGTAYQDLIVPGNVNAPTGAFAIGVYQHLSLTRDLDDATPLLGSLDTLLWDGETSASSIGLGTGDLFSGPYSIGFKVDAATDVQCSVAGIVFSPIITAPPGPSITSHDPIRAGGTDVAINGENMSNVKLVLLDGRPQANVRVISDTLVLFDVDIGGVRMSNTTENPITLIVRE